MMMKRLGLCLTGIALLLLIVLPVWATDPPDERSNVTATLTKTDGDAQEEFWCYATDSKGRRYELFENADDGMLYLFVPSDVTPENISLHYSGTLADTTSGTICPETGEVLEIFAGEVIATVVDGANQSHVIKLMHSMLPAVYITMAKQTTLEELHADKSVKFKKNTVEIIDPSNKYSMKVENAVEMKGRGNSTWELYDKKGYQIKFKNATSVLGMDAAKKWVLLANAGDDSLMRTQLVYRMAQSMDMEFIPTFEYADLWINGEYRGLYIIGEKVEIGSTRLALQDVAGAIYEHDEAFYEDEDHWLYNDLLQRHFVLKEINNEEEPIISAAMEDFNESLNEFMSYLYSTPLQSVTLEELGKMIDVDSFAKYYLINEYVLNCESYATSFYWYKDGKNDVIHLGPIWDFDTCMGNDGKASTASYGENHVLFQYLLSSPAFYNRTQELWTQYREQFFAMTTDTSNLLTLIQNSAQMNYLRWDVLGKQNPKVGSTAFAPTYEQAVEHLQSWLRSRTEHFEIVTLGSVTSVVDEDCKRMSINFWDGNSYDSIRFGVWSLENGQDDLMWYQATQNSKGEWVASVDLTKHATKGLYRIVARPGDSMESIGSGYNYVNVVAESDYKTDITISDDCRIMSVRMSDRGLCSEVSFAVWSEEDGQDDLRWYDATRNGDTWDCDIDLSWHRSAGRYYIHAYGTVDGQRSMVNAETADVESAVSGPVITAKATSDERYVDLKIENVDTYSRMWAPVWSVQGGQDDLVWYELEKTGDSCWETRIILANHGVAGDYMIHFYGGDVTPTTLVADYKLFISNVSLKKISAEVNESCDTMTITVEGIKEGQQLWLPVWSDENGQDDIRWYRPEYRRDGVYVAVIDLRNHMSAGAYHIHLYGGETQPSNLIDYTTVQVVSLPSSKPALDMKLENGILYLTAYNCEQMAEIWIPVWSEEDGQDDIRWYRPQKQPDGIWTLEADLAEHGSTGIYHIHMYTGSDGPSELLDYVDIQVEQLPDKPRLKIEILNSKLAVSVKNAESEQKIWIAAWSSEDMKDLCWYLAERQEDADWDCAIALEAHNVTGVIHIHAYAGENEPEQLIAYADWLM